MSKMRPEQMSKTAHPCIYPGIRRSFVDAFLDRGVDWIKIDHIPWHQNPLVIWEGEAAKNGKIKYGKRKAHEWRYKGHIYHRDIFNHIWQKKEGKMIWIGNYIPELDIIDHTTSEPR